MGEEEIAIMGSINRKINGVNTNVYHFGYTDYASGARKYISLTREQIRQIAGSLLESK